MKRTVTTAVDVPRASGGLPSLRIELTFAAEEVSPPAEQASTVAAVVPPGEPRVDPEARRPAEQGPAFRPMRRRTPQEASAPPPRLCARQAGEVGRRVAEAVCADAAQAGSDPDALLEVAARVAASYHATMQTVAGAASRPVLLRVRVGEVGGRTSVDLEP